MCQVGTGKWEHGKRKCSCARRPSGNTSSPTTTSLLHSRTWPSAPPPAGTASRPRGPFERSPGPHAGRQAAQRRQRGRLCARSAIRGAQRLRTPVGGSTPEHAGRWEYSRVRLAAGRRQVPRGGAVQFADGADHTHTRARTHARTHTHVHCNHAPAQAHAPTPPARQVLTLMLSSVSADGVAPHLAALVRAMTEPELLAAETARVYVHSHARAHTASCSTHARVRYTLRKAQHAPPQRATRGVHRRTLARRAGTSR